MSHVILMSVILLYVFCHMSTKVISVLYRRFVIFCVCVCVCSGFGCDVFWSVVFCILFCKSVKHASFPNSHGGRGFGITV